MFAVIVASRAPIAVELGMATWAVALWIVYRRSVRLVRPDVYFGVTVPTDWPDSPPGRAVGARYRRRTDVAFVVAVCTALASTLPWASVDVRSFVAIGGLIVQALTATAAYLAGRRAVLPMAVVADRVRHASVDEDDGPTLSEWAWRQVLPLAVLAASAGLLAWRYPTLPARVAVHSGFDGQADRWAAKSVGTVFGPAVIGVLFCAFSFAVGAVTIHSGRRLREAGRRDRYLSGVLLLLLAGECCGAVWMAVVGWVPAAAGTRWAAVPWYLVFGTTPVLAAVVTLIVMRRWPAPAADGGHGDGTPDRCWRWGLFYVNADDPAVLVPKRFGYGYTVNLARGETYALLGGGWRSPRRSWRCRR